MKQISLRNASLAVVAFSAFLCATAAAPPAVYRGTRSATVPQRGIFAPNRMRGSGFRAARRSFAIRHYRGHNQLIQFPTPIQHVVVIMMENRTPDNLFYAYGNSFFPGGQYWSTALDLDTTVPLTQFGLEAPFDPVHAHLGAFDYEAAGEYYKEPYYCPKTLGYCPHGRTAYAYVPTSETAPYAALITNYAYANHVFQSNEGPSFPAHQYAIAGQSGGYGNPPGQYMPLHTPYAAVENAGSATPTPLPNATDLLITDAEAENAQLSTCSQTLHVVKTIDLVNDTYPGTERRDHHYAPCDEYETIFDRMTERYPLPYIADWQYVGDQDTDLWAAPLSVNHLYQHYINDSNKANEPFNADPDALQFISNIAAGAPQRPLAQLTYITPCQDESDHPNEHYSSDGPQWVGYVVNAIGNSKYWPNTTIIVEWDDWGGWYDHYGGPPNSGPFPLHPLPNAYNNNAYDPNEWGFRVPMMVISPYIKYPAYVSNTPRSQGAILQYIEHTFNLQSLGTDDVAGGNDDLSDMFDFGKPTPMPFVRVPTTFAKTSPGLVNCMHSI